MNGTCLPRKATWLYGKVLKNIIGIPADWAGATLHTSATEDPAMLTQTRLRTGTVAYPYLNSALRPGSTSGGLGTLELMVKTNLPNTSTR
jgi:hypothetical protein